MRPSEKFTINKSNQGAIKISKVVSHDVRWCRLTMAYAQPFPLAAPQTKGPHHPTYGPDLAVRLICPECRDPNPNIVEEFGSGDLVCGNCGLILGDRIVDTRSEWRVGQFSFIISFGRLTLFVMRHSRMMKEMIHLVLVLHRIL